MGSISELADRDRNKRSFYRARELIERYGDGCPPEAFIKAYDEGLTSTDLWFRRMTGREEWRIFVYYGFSCSRHPESIQAIQEICDNNPDLFGYSERPCKESDFFLFHPQDEDIGVKLGLDIHIKTIMEPWKVSRYFKDIVLDAPDGNDRPGLLVLDW